MRNNSERCFLAGHGGDNNDGLETWWGMVGTTMMGLRHGGHGGDNNDGLETPLKFAHRTFNDSLT